GFLTLKAFVIVRLEKLALHARRTDFESVAASWQDVFNVEDGPDLLGHQFAIGVSDAGRLIDRDTDQSLVAAAFNFDLDQFHTFRLNYALRDFLDFGRHRFPHRSVQVSNQTKKWAFAHSQGSTLSSNVIVPWKTGVGYVGQTVRCSRERILTMPMPQNGRTSSNGSDV